MATEREKRTLRLSRDARGKVRAEIDGQPGVRGEDYDNISAVGRLVLAHPERFGVGWIITAEPVGQN